MADILSRLTHLAEHAISRLKVRSALNSCLWLVGIVTPTSLLAAMVTTGPTRAACLCLGCAPVALFAIGFLYFMVRDPDKLRSEQYELRKQALELIEEKGERFPVAGASVEAIANEYVGRKKQLVVRHVIIFG